MTTKTFGSIAGLAVCVGVLAACSSGTTTAIPNGGGSAAAGAAGATANVEGKPLSEYLLQQSDVPAGYTAMQVPSGASSITGSVLDATKNSKITPSSCQPDLSKLSAADADSAPKALFTNASSGKSIVTAINPAADSGASIEDFEKYNLGDCASHEVASSVSGQSFTAKVTSEKVDVDVPGIDGAVTVQQTTDTEIPGIGPRTSTALIALIPVPGGTMTVQVSDLLGSGSPDESLFETVVAAAAKRVTG